MQPDMLTWCAWEEPKKAPLPVLVEDDDQEPDDGIAIAVDGEQVYPAAPPVLELEGMDLPEALEPWEEAPTQKIQLPMLPSSSSQAYIDDPPTLAPACERLPLFGVGVRSVQAGAAWSGCMLPLLIGMLSMPILVWLLSVLLGGRMPAQMAWWLLEQSR